MQVTMALFDHGVRCRGIKTTV